MDMAKHAVKFFVALQKLDSDSPNQRTINVEAVRQFNYEQFKKNISSRSEAPGVATLWNIQRQWGEMGIKEYVRTPEASPETVERRIFDICSFSK